MRYWFTSDEHFGHGLIVEYANRPFASCDEMNAVMIRKFNERVKPEDVTFIIGDFCFKSGLGCAKSTWWLDQLNGQKIIVKGNHDGGIEQFINAEIIPAEGFVYEKLGLLHGHSWPKSELMEWTQDKKLAQKRFDEAGNESPARELAVESARGTCYG